MDLKNTKTYLTKNNFFPSKKLGQNFLINQNICQEIVKAVDTKNVDLIIEIGPGLGSITDFLIDKKVELILIEFDKRLNEFLNKRFIDIKQIKIINNDVLKVSLDELVKQHKNPIIVSNLPYSISSQVLFQFMECNKIRKGYFMLQKEMVERIKAKPKTKNYNGFSAAFNYYCDVKNIMTLNGKNFEPQPDVDSVFIEIIKKNKNYDSKFIKFLNESFKMKRKTLYNNLKTLYGNQTLKALKNKNISETIRAEELSTEVLFDLYKTLDKNEK